MQKATEDNRTEVQKRHGIIAPDKTLVNSLTLRDYLYLFNFLKETPIPELAAQSSRAYSYFTALGKRSTDPKYQAYDALEIFRSLKDLSSELTDFCDSASIGLSNHDFAEPVNVMAFIYFIESNSGCNAILFELEMATSKLTRTFTPETVTEGTKVLFFIEKVSTLLGNIQANQRAQLKEID